MIEKFQSTFRNEIEMVQLLQLQQIQKFVCIWNDHLLENSELSKQEKLLKELSDDQTQLELLLNQCCIELIDQNLNLLTLLTQFFGLIIPIKLIHDENLPYIIERYHSQNNKYAKLLIALFREFNYRELNICLPSIADFEIGQILRFNKINLFDKTFIQIQQNIISYQCQKSQELLDQIIKQLNNLKIYQTNQLQLFLIQQVQKYIDYESQELAELFYDIELNEYYESIQQLKDVKVIRTKQDLYLRKLFIQDEVVHIPEDEVIEYKEMAAFEAKNLFIIKKTITAFMNSKGGTLFIGIKDSLVAKGFNSGNNIYQCKAFLYEQCIDFINPQLKQGSEILIDFLPLLTNEGIIVDGFYIIKITLMRSQFNQNVYTFSELIEHLHCEATFCFKRYGDESKAVKHQHLKQLIKLMVINGGYIPEQRQGRNLVTRSISNNKRCSSQKSQEKENFQSQIFYKYEFKQQQQNAQFKQEYYNQSFRNDSQIQILQPLEQNELNQNQLIPKFQLEQLEQLDILEQQDQKQIQPQLFQPQQQQQQQLQQQQSQQQYEESLVIEVKPKKEWENWIIIRKITSSIYEKLMNYLQLLVVDQKIQKIISASTTIHIKLNNITGEEFIQHLKVIFDENKESIQFLYGHPHIIKVEKTDFPLEEAIAQGLKLHNYVINQKSECQVLIAKHVEDLIEIYKYIRLELKIEVHWKLRQPKNIIIKSGIEQVQQQQQEQQQI